MLNITNAVAVAAFLAASLAASLAATAATANKVFVYHAVAVHCVRGGDVASCRPAAEYT